ncbi:hypothetical protein [Streptomyces tritici]|uniref:hypothetical protein n=1 Tax=Streptomyces tritici TaxID=2054410 RepID=UPI003AEF6555
MTSVRHRLGLLRGRLVEQAAARRAWLMQRFFLPARRRRVARLRYAAVLDGQTMNLHAELPTSEALPQEAEIRLRRGLRRRHHVPARVYEDRDGTLLMDAAVLLGDEVGGVPVDTGRWKLHLLLHHRRRTRRLPLLLVEPPVPYGGPTKPMTASPITGDRHRIGRTVTGNARLVTSEARPAAEIARVDLSHSGLVVDVRVLGAEVHEPWAEFKEKNRRIECPLEQVGPATWRVVVPLERMELRRATDHWDVVLRASGVRPLRFGRRLHDVRNPLRVFAIKETVVAPSGRTPLIVHPRYTAAGNFRITCSRMPEAGRRH